MTKFTQDDYEAYQQDIEIVVDTLRQCFLADQTRYFIDGSRDLLVIEIEGLDELSQDEITDVAEPVLNELDVEFDEILLISLKK